MPMPFSIVAEEVMTGGFQLEGGCAFLSGKPRVRPISLQNGRIRGGEWPLPACIR